MTAALGLGAAALAPPSAGAAGLAPAVADCYQNGRLTHHYSVSALRSALGSLPADIAEYSNCHDIIQHQLLLQLGELHPGGGVGSGGGPFLPVWLIAVLAALLATAGGFGAAAIRNRRRGG